MYIYIYIYIYVYIYYVYMYIKSSVVVLCNVPAHLSYNE